MKVPHPLLRAYSAFDVNVDHDSFNKHITATMTLGRGGRGAPTRTVVQALRQTLRASEWYAGCAVLWRLLWQTSQRSLHAAQEHGVNPPMLLYAVRLALALATDHSTPVVVVVVVVVAQLEFECMLR